VGASLIIVVIGPVLAAAGIGGSLWSLAGFLVIFGVAVMPLIVRELRPTVRLLSSSDHTERLAGGRTSVTYVSEVSTASSPVSGRPRRTPWPERAAARPRRVRLG
jgi:hypothetical protein